jgi:hypothetical protein
VDCIMERALSASPPVSRPSQTGGVPLSFKLGFLAVLLWCALPVNVLYLLGWAYDETGGNPLVKLHPATYVVIVGAGLAILQRTSLRQSRSVPPGVIAFITIVFLCALYSMVSVGIAASSIYVESYLAAGFLAIALETGSDRGKRLLGYVLLTIIVLNVFISVGEGLTYTHLFPLHLGANVDPKTVESADLVDFRGAAFYQHPLSGALVTSLGVILLFTMRLRPWLEISLFLLLVTGLLSFGGRAALAVTGLTVIGAALWIMFRDLLTRRVNARTATTLVVLGILAPLMVVVLLAATNIGSRIVAHMYYDTSAQVRNVQWDVLSYINVRDFLFGATRADVELFKSQLGLGGAGTDIENPWLLMFLNLGLFAFVPFLIGLGAFFVHLGRTARHPAGWVMIIAFLAIASTSNSLGVKTSDLCFLTTCIIAMSGFLTKPERAAAQQPKPTPKLRGAFASLVVPHRVLTKDPVRRGNSLAEIDF